MRSDIPMYSQVPEIILKTPWIKTTPINQEIESNTSLGFVFNNVNSSVTFASVIKASRPGNLCDRQRVNNWVDSKDCGCYVMSTNSSSLVIQHSIGMTTYHGMMNMGESNSLKFGKFYLNKETTGSFKLYILQLT